jgi:protein ImuB
MRYAAALSLAPGLRAAVVPPDEIERALAAIDEILHRFTPGVESSGEEPGVFWLDASGLERLYESLTLWADSIRADLRDAGWCAGVVVGYSRFGTYAAARVKQGTVIFSDRNEENSVARQVALDRLGLEPGDRDALHKLGIDTVGRLAELPPEGIVKRFGPGLLRLHRLATGALGLPLQPRRLAPPPVERRILDHPEADVARLLRVVEALLHPLLATLASRNQVLAGLHLGFHFERLGEHIEYLRPAAPTGNATTWIELVRLRLEALRRLPDGVTEIVLLAEGAAVASEERVLFAERPRRDIEAANRALARVRADLGQDAVMHARLREGHLPESRFEWEALEQVTAGRSRREPETGRLVRRIYARPLPLPARPRREPDGWLLSGLEQGPVVRIHGPYVVAGGWWDRSAVRREYHFAETQKGELLWVYYDRDHRRWFLQGRVE